MRLSWFKKTFVAFKKFFKSTYCSNMVKKPAFIILKQNFDFLKQQKQSIPSKRVIII